MRHHFQLGIFALCASLLACAASAQDRVHHVLDVTLDAASGTVTASADVTPNGDVRELEFLLHSRLRVTSATPAVREVPVGDVGWLGEIEGGDLQQAPAVKRYRVTLPSAGASFHIEYEGVFDVPLSDAREEYTRGFRSTPGIVSPAGVYLPGASGWYPLIGRALMTFQLTVAQPPTWRVVSEGAGTSRDADGRARWASTDPVDQVHIVGGPLQMTTQAAGAVEAQVYLHEPDAALSAKYLAATAQYLEMYRGLIGPYPYKKFALVENFWETGYGMPSFTLLGPQIIRFPFILTSSYPHEILHNWWGNSVFVDEARGNWSEGLTAYIADHLMQEQRGEDAVYRRSTLQKYRDYVSSAQDFPLVQFRGRHSAATEAIGYGRTMMGFHSLRRAVGDDTFRKFLARFYRDYKGKRASFDDVRKTMEAVSGQDFGRFFADWIERAGAPSLAVTAAVMAQSDVPRLSQQTRAGGYVIEGTIAQTQPGAPFASTVPVVVQTAGKVVEVQVPLTGSSTAFRIETPDAPLLLHVDPAFDSFRRLDARETPSSLGQLFGDPAPLVVIAASEDPARAAAYRAMAESWKAPAHAPSIVLDTEVTMLPADRSVWLFGSGNRFANAFVDGAAVRLASGAVTIDGQEMPLRDHAAIVVRRHPGNETKAVGWIVADRVDAMPGLARKLPHYGKYSYLGFEGAEPVNMLKGQWQASDSPLTVDLRSARHRTAPMAPLVLSRAPLATLPAVFSETSLQSHVSTLSSVGYEGRGFGTAGMEKAAAYVTEQFKAVGLVPGMPGGSYRQEFTTTQTRDGRAATLANIVGVLEGSDPAWRDQSVVVMAHYDHLGLGWPNPRAGDEGKLHPGADDNASGVAVLLEVARAMGAAGSPRRTVVFVAVTAEEAGMLGSKHYVEAPVRPRAGIRSALNIDSVGRLGTAPVGVIGASTATEWPHVFRGIGFVTGIQTQLATQGIEASDQVSFIARGIPAVQLFTPPHGDYHRPGDTADKVDIPGMVRVATVAREAVSYLAERPEPLTVTIAASGATAAAPAAGGAAPTGTTRRAGFGIVPDFAFAGPGVKASGLVPQSPAEQAGMKAGDVLLEMAGTPLASLSAYSDVLKTLTPGQTVPIVFEQEGVRRSATVTLTAR
jgi:aminopeptidase N